MMDNLGHEIARADRNAVALMAAARSSLDLIEAAIMADERGRTIGDPRFFDDADRAAIEWRTAALQQLGVLRATLAPSENDTTH